MKVCAKCLNCGHRGVIEEAALRKRGIRIDITLAELSRTVVCDKCGGHAVLVERRKDTVAFIEGAS